jgi:hypothetical protein
VKELSIFSKEKIMTIIIFVAIVANLDKLFLILPGRRNTYNLCAVTPPTSPGDPQLAIAVIGKDTYTRIVSQDGK